MLFKEFASLNPGLSETELINDLEELCGLEGSEAYCEALDDYYSWGLSKENVLRPVVISAKRTIAKAKKKPGNIILIVLLIAIIIAALVWYFKFYKNR